MKILKKRGQNKVARIKRVTRIQDVPEGYVRPIHFGSQYSGHISKWASDYKIRSYHVWEYDGQRRPVKYVNVDDVHDQIGELKIRKARRHEKCEQSPPKSSDGPVEPQLASIAAALRDLRRRVTTIETAMASRTEK